MEYILTLTFLCTSGNKANLTIDGVKSTITQAEIELLMNSIIANNVFCPKNGEFTGKSGASLTQRNITSYQF